MKIKIFRSYYNLANQDFEDKVNKFLSDVEVISITSQVISPCTDGHIVVTIVYKTKEV